MAVVEIDGTTLSCSDVTAVAHGADVVLTAAGRERAARSWQFAQRTAQRRPLYGRSTGVGANRTVTVAGNPREHTLALLRSHATSAGAERSPERIRAMLAVRLNQLAAGGSGVDPVVLDGLEAMLAADALPAVREWGSIGTGDLSALATTALALLGEGRTSRPLPSTTTFGAADGLAFISSNAATLADAALATQGLANLSGAAVVIAALTFVAVRGNSEAFAPVIRRVTPFPGARLVSDRMWRLIRDQVPTPARIQDPFGLRTLPQVQGVVLDAVDHAIAVIEQLAGAPSENPVLLPGPVGDDGVVAHHGGFHLSYLQAALDGLNLAVAQSGQSVRARMATLVEPALSHLPAFLGDGTPGASGVMICEYVASSVFGAIRAAAIPAGLQSVTVSRGVEDDASFASLAAANTLQIAGLYPTLLGCELVMAVRALRMLELQLTGPLARALQMCADLPVETADRDLTVDLTLAEQLVPQLADVLVGVPDDDGAGPAVGGD